MDFVIKFNDLLFQFLQTSLRDMREILIKNTYSFYILPRGIVAQFDIILEKNSSIEQVKL